MVTVLFPFELAWIIGVILTMTTVAGVAVVWEWEESGESIVAAIITAACGYAAFKILAACFGALS